MYSKNTAIRRAVYDVWRTMYIVRHTMFIVRRAMYILGHTMYVVQYHMFDVQCTLCIVRDKAIYNAQRILSCIHLIIYIM